MTDQIKQEAERATRLRDQIDELADQALDRLKAMLDDEDLSARDRVAVVKAIMSCRGQAHRVAGEAQKRAADTDES